jgi:hypothetical protein
LAIEEEPMMNKFLVINSLLLAFSLTLSACVNPAPTQDPSQAATQFAEQIKAAIEATQKAQPTATPFIPTAEAVFTPTESQPGMPTSGDCNPPPLNLGENYPDGSTIYINTSFNKSWTLQNAGTCTWNANYKIKFMSGNMMGGPASKLFGTTVLPGGSITLTLPLKTPGTIGTTKGVWGLYDDKDIYFGWVSVEINSATGSPITTGFSVTNVTTRVDNPGPFRCTQPHTFNFMADITANGAGTVTYHWTNSDSGNSTTRTLLFGAAGTKTVVYDWTISSADAGKKWVKVYIDNPNNQAFPQVNFTCWS